MTQPAKITRHDLRIAAMQALFQLDVQGDAFIDQIDSFVGDQQVKPDQLVFIRQLVQWAWVNRVDIDQRITQASQHWDLHRMTPIDRAILRLALGELMFTADSPPKVVMNEAIELAKAFGTAESPQFINGLLDAIYKKWKMENEGQNGK